MRSDWMMVSRNLPSPLPSSRSFIQLLGRRMTHLCLSVRSTISILYDRLLDIADRKHNIPEEGRHWWLRRSEFLALRGCMHHCARMMGSTWYTYIIYTKYMYVYQSVSCCVRPPKRSAGSTVFSFLPPPSSWVRCWLKPGWSFILWTGIENRCTALP